MWEKVKNYFCSTKELVGYYEKVIVNKNTHIKKVEAQLKTQKEVSQRYENLLANRNGTEIQAQAIHVSQHAIYRYKERLGSKDTDEQIRQRIYKLLLQNLKVMDKLTDGTYPLDQNMVCRVRDNTVATCMKRQGKH